MERRFDWSDIISELDIETDNILTARVILEVCDESKFFDFLRKLPNDIDRHFRASRVCLFFPGTGLDTEQSKYLFDLRLMLHPARVTDQRSARAAFNAYFDEIRKVIEHELTTQS
jgi:hypothetical protein